MNENVCAKDFFGVDEFRHFSLPVTDNCNLHCVCCSTRSNIPINSDSNILCRREEYRIPLSDLRLFCEKLDGVGYNDWHRLTGGEPTLYPELVEDCIKILDGYNRKICLFTNGFQVKCIRPEFMHKVGWIELDDHGVNHDDVVRTRRYLKDIGYEGWVHNIKYKVHYDLEYAMYHSKNDVCCGHMCRVVMMFNHTVYPCAHHYCTELFFNTFEFSELLRETGYDLDDDWMVLLQNWRTSIHGDIWEMCYSCWRPYYKLKKFPKMRKR